MSAPYEDDDDEDEGSGKVLLGLCVMVVAIVWFVVYVSDRAETQRIVRDCLEGKVLTPSAYCDRVIGSQYSKPEVD
jgi:hypothetical protein